MKIQVNDATNFFISFKINKTEILYIATSSIIAKLSVESTYNASLYGQKNLRFKHLDAFSAT